MDRFARFHLPIARCSLVALCSLIPTQLTFAVTSGIAGYSGETVDCATTCHTNVLALPTVTLSGPETVTPNKPSTYTLVITGGPATAAGMDVTVGGGGGLLTATMTGTKKVGRDIVHSAPTALTAGSATYTFLWTAPSSNGTFTIYAAGMSSNGSGSGGDGTVVKMLSVSVAGVADPADPPITPDGTAGTGGTTGTGEALFNSMCSSCHGGATPPEGSITGSSATDIRDAFAAEPEHAPFLTMSDANVDAIAAFLNGAMDTGAGATLFASLCSTCHNDGIGGDITGSSASEIRDAFAEEPEHAPFLTMSDANVDAIAAFLGGASGSEEEEEFGTGSNATTKGKGHASAAKASAAGSFDLLSLLGAGLLAAGVGRRRKK